jgi:catechol 2,3-dioxygenase-like lactoylglutathione lyase family enzyme
VASIRTAAPQILVRNLNDSLAFYRDRLGFEADFVYGDFYAGVSRDGALIHLKCDAKSEAERAHRGAREHLDAYLEVCGIRELHDELAGRGAPISKSLDRRPWGTIDFYVRDPDGNILCFSEVA